MNTWISTTLPTPPSVNKLPLNHASAHYRRVRNQWMQDIAYTFDEAGNKLPRPLARVKASALLTFTKHRRRDSGNYRALLEKWCGDALQHKGIIPDDTHDIYEFGHIQIIVAETEGFNLILHYEKDSHSGEAQ